VLSDALRVVPIPNGGGVNGSQLFDAGFTDRGEGLLICLPLFADHYGSAP
tara:strand:- start:414 stop:563 length:150 start_codon:yes stop_codon:yes gene_type:complete